MMSMAGFDQLLPEREDDMPHVNLLHEIDLLRRGTLVLVTGVVLVAFAALAIAATVYDVGRWLAIW
jgi:hypothetical protein